MVRAIEAAGIVPVVDHTFELARIAEAFNLQAAGGHFGKIALKTEAVGWTIDPQGTATISPLCVKFDNPGHSRSHRER
jgi:hypothetical protein